MPRATTSQRAKKRPAKGQRPAAAGRTLAEAVLASLEGPPVDPKVRAWLESLVAGDRSERERLGQQTETAGVCADTA